MDWEQVLDELYGLPPADFTATRDDRARTARREGDRELATRIGALRRPPAAAWALNLLVRAEPGQVDRLLSLGEAMREAQESLAGPELRELRVQQHKVLEALRVRATALVRAAGGKLGADAGEQLVATLRAGMTDAAAADAVRSGRLVRVLEATGFGGDDAIDVDDAVAGEGPAPVTATPRRARARTARPAATAAPRAVSAPPPDELRARRQEKERREAERAAAEEERRARERREHEEALDRAREELDEARHAEQEAAAEAGTAATRTADLQRRHEDLLAQAETVADRLEAARASARAAERAAHAALERRARAERALERLDP